MRLVYIELHAIQFLQQIVWKFDVGFIDLIDEQYNLFLRGKGVPHFSALDVVTDVLNPVVAKLGISQPAHGIVLVETLASFGLRFDMPLNQRHPESVGNLFSEQGLACSRFSLHQ